MDKKKFIKLVTAQMMHGSNEVSGGGSSGGSSHAASIALEDGTSILLMETSDRILTE